MLVDKLVEYAVHIEIERSTQLNVYIFIRDIQQLLVMYGAQRCVINRGDTLKADTFQVLR